MRSASSATDDLDLAAVELGRNDPLASVNPGKLARVRSAICGAGRSYALADPRLEALRRYAILYRTSPIPAAWESEASGDRLTDEDRRRVRAIVDGWVTPPLRAPRGRPWLAPTALALAACLVGRALL